MSTTARSGSTRSTEVGDAPLVLRCADFDAALAMFTGTLGLRVDSIFPADAPRVAVVSGRGVALRLERDDGAAEPDVAFAPGAVVVTRAGPDLAWRRGRAGMLYRDLIPGRLGGRVVASHIRIPDAGEVPDYVHHHDVRFQMIFCRAGWVRVVYEDQGAPFVMEAGDCVLQPPGIRHRVLESSAGLEVIELGAPAVHETFADHELALPTRTLAPEREYGGQRFVRHRAVDASWRAADGFEVCATAIAGATRGLAAVRMLRAVDADAGLDLLHDGQLRFVYVLEGSAVLRGATLVDPALARDDCATIPPGAAVALVAARGAQLLEIRLSAEG